ncbi:MAG: hemerythrin family protein [Leptospirales bacterium]|nr:hemerythrin family protein [Leptospirales bacterium]
MAFVWKEEWAIGREQIDSQHRELFKTVNSLIDACHAGKGFNVIDDTMNFLLNYTVKHFNDEETLQRQIGFPGYRGHKKLHDDFKAQAMGLAAKVKAGHSNVVIMQVSQTIGEWLVNHVGKEDRKIGEHLKERKKAISEPDSSDL